MRIHFLIIKTKIKIKIASLIFNLLKLFLPNLKQNSCLISKRKGIEWSLDLSEGIDLSIYVLGCFEKETAKALKRIISSDNYVLDIGANIGAHTLPIAAMLGKKGKVLAVEPTKFAFDKLKINLALNENLSHCVKTYQIMFVDDCDFSHSKKLYSSWPITNNKQFGSHADHGGVLKSLENCSIETLDGFCERIRLSKLDLIKLDVDGAEAAVIRGGIKTLTKFHPIIIMELAPYVYENETSFMSMIDSLKDLNYRFYYLNGKKIANQNRDSIHSLVPKGSGLNVIAM